ncbi:nitroreductase [Natranaerovirga hydrolytica]|uniref:Nitroreductase n=1 Tax=Natranaerovirga hydrolytica TaxID=680378 RepID=A0A4R1MJK0_9FIRM|nr:nitroreductase family protein [Natranaerovirga hydrolytica]TCK92896.1 nitroreductase [Natranaerovirga hydrolytica]
MKIFDDSITAIIKKRKSVRTYDNKSISEKDLELIQGYINNEANITSPLGRKVKFSIMPVNNNKTEKGQKIGTYGFIKNPQGYIVGVIENNEEALVEFGYVFEKLILFLTQIGIGTCWLGGTFNRNTFIEEVLLEEKEIIPCITPIGYEKDKKRILDKTFRSIIKADNRKPWEELFFYDTFHTPLSQNAFEEMAMPLEMVRLSPSASNKQPYRVLISNDKKTFHFYLEKTPNYAGNKMGFDMQRIDMGIGMSHFELTCQEMKIEGRWVKKDPDVSLPNEHYRYVMSWVK